MNERIDGRRAASEITKALSLRAPQRESLDILADLLEKLELSKDADLQHWLKTIRAQYPTVEKVWKPDPGRRAVYDRLYRKYRALGDFAERASKE